MEINPIRGRHRNGVTGLITIFSLCLASFRSNVSVAFTSTTLQKQPSLSRLSRVATNNEFRKQQQLKHTTLNNLPGKNILLSVDTCCNVATSNTELSSSSSSSSFKNNNNPSNNKNNDDKHKRRKHIQKKQNNNRNNKQNDDSTTISNKKNRRQTNNGNKRKRTKSQAEEASERLRKYRQEQYELLREQSSLQAGGNDKNSTPSIWGFEALFPEPVWDAESVYRDLYEVSDREKELEKTKTITTESRKRPFIVLGEENKKKAMESNRNSSLSYKPPPTASQQSIKNSMKSDVSKPQNETTTNSTITDKGMVDRTLTRMVEDRVYGLLRPKTGDYYYDVSSISDGAVQFSPDGKRVGNPLKVNCDRLTYHAKRELAKGHFEEARELYEEAVRIDPRDGRGYLGLSRICNRRRDFESAKKHLKVGILNSWDPETGGRNAFLLQALGCLEERVGHLSEAERLYIQAAKERPWHAASWVALAQLRTRKLRKGAHAGRVCYQSAERELMIAGKPPSSHVYTAWASLEYRKAGNFRRAKELFEKALECDPKCSVAYLQLGVMEADNENWDNAKRYFETALMFDQRNSRILQAYAIMESKRPDGDPRYVIDLFERALRAKPKDAGVLQAYALFVVDLGDIKAGRELLERATQADPKHAPAWQAWGVLETRHGTPSKARDVFQQGIWKCAQSGGGQSGGFRCARLWQAWGVLESREEEYAAARRCFSRALDSDNRNIAAVTAWAMMEQKSGNIKDARSIFERALKRLSGGSDDKMTLWRAYETMEIRDGNVNEAQIVYQRSMRDAMISNQNELEVSTADFKKTPPTKEILRKSNDNEVEVVSWRTKKEFGEEEVWINNGSIEGKVPTFNMNNRKKKRED